ncbi:hypothetical protein [Chromobacterium sp. IIBBL 290-4]|uniref:hypothetical protein n=1 Tax=Chromobacterium sp. IIBBL 290-4 TaxID=2953890 RepID=UPI0020B6B4C0|nr:hypothetical protein [Chromobacterium sp. IIBBL 290-4]UTH76831.1 hypothetical protein NKT35_10115 [Chromobacterium sp. IIBBL 290-4]
MALVRGFVGMPSRAWLAYYNHQGKMCCGRTPLQTFIEGKSEWREKVDKLN